MPKISIVMPSCNQVAYLKQAIESVLSQTYPNKELIIIDGGSIDGSLDIIKEYEGMLGYWVSERDNGQSHAIRKGIAKSSGEWINWINSDDALLPGALKAVAKAAVDHPHADVIVGRGVFGDAKGTFTKVTIPVSPRMWRPRHVCYGPFCQQATFWTRKAYESVGGVDESLFFRMDVDLLERMLSNGHKAIAISDAIGFFRIYSTTKSATSQDVRQREFDARLSELGISKLGRWAAANSMRAYRLLCGNYFRCRVASLLIRSQNLSDCWRKALAAGNH